MLQTDDPESGTAPLTTPGKPSRASTMFAIALITTALVVAGLVLWAAFGDCA
jgi:hypothetical protein